MMIYSETLPGDVFQFSTNQLQLRNGDVIFVEVVGVNGAGGHVGVNSSTVTIDLTPPELTTIVDGGDLMEDIQYQPSNASLMVSWEVSDTESGIYRILGNIFEVREGRRIRIYPDGGEGEVVPVDPTLWNVDGLELNSGSRYIPSLTFTNGAGLVITHESNGVIVDSTPPTVLFVSVSRATPNQTEARWHAIDAESGINYYQVGVVDENGTLVTQGYTTFEGTASGGTVETPNLPTGMLFWISLFAVNRAGIRSEEVMSSQYFRSVLKRGCGERGGGEREGEGGKKRESEGRRGRGREERKGGREGGEGGSREGGRKRKREGGKGEEGE